MKKFEPRAGASRLSHPGSGAGKLQGDASRSRMLALAMNPPSRRNLRHPLHSSGPEPEQRRCPHRPDPQQRQPRYPGGVLEPIQP